MSVRYINDERVGYVVGRVSFDTASLSTGATIADQIIPVGAIIIGCEVAILTAFDGTVTTFNVGHAGNPDAGATASDITHGTVGVYEGTAWRTGTAATDGLTSARALQIRINGTNTTGEAQVVLWYMRAVTP